MTSVATIVTAAKSNMDSIMPLDLDTRYKGDETTQIVAKAMGVAYCPDWSVVDEDTENKLALAHYTMTADTLAYGAIRGVIVDTELGIVIANSFGHTPTAVLDNGQQLTKDIDIIDTDGVTHKFDLSKSIIKRAFEGVVLRVFWHKGKLFRVTHKKIESSRSRWGSSKYFVTLYEEAGGPTAEQLFDTTKPFSDTCYDFLVVDASLIVGSRQRVNKPYLVLLATRKYNCQRPSDQWAPALGNFTTSKNIDGLVSESFIHDPQPLTIEEANIHLRYGYYDAFDTDDSRMGTGEELIIYTQDNQGNVVNIVKVSSRDYKYRCDLRADNPNIAHQFYTLLDMCYPEISDVSAWNDFKKRLIIFPLYDIEAVRDLFNQTQGIMSLPVARDASYQEYISRDDRIHLLFLNYLVTLPVTCQKQCIDMYVEYLRDRDDLVKWLAALEYEHKNKHKNELDKLELHKRIITLITAVRDLAEKDIKEGRNYSRKGMLIQRNTLIKDKFRNLILKERGTSLYALVREMKRAREPKTQQ